MESDVQLEVLKTVARQRLTAGQTELGLGLERTGIAEQGHGWWSVADQVGVPSASAGPDHRADQQARQPAGAGRDGRRGGRLPYMGLPTLYLCPFPAWAPLLSRLASAHAHKDRWALILCDACAAAALP